MEIFYSKHKVSFFALASCSVIQMYYTFSVCLLMNFRAASYVLLFQTMSSYSLTPQKCHKFPTFTASYGSWVKSAQPMEPLALCKLRTPGPPWLDEGPITAQLTVLDRGNFWALLPQIFTLPSPNTSSLHSVWPLEGPQHTPQYHTYHMPQLEGL